MTIAGGLSLVAATLLGLCRHQVAERDWNFKPDYDMWVQYRLPNQWTVAGHLNVAGTFVRSPTSGESTGHLGFSPAINDPAGDLGDKWRAGSETVYEFRCGVLVRGTLRYPGNFTPAVGEKPISFTEYRRTEGGRPAPRIYNLPGRLVTLKPGQRPTPYTPPPTELAPYRDWTRDGKPADIDEVLRSIKKYKPAVDRRVGIRLGKLVDIGRLTQEGVFVLDRAIEPVEYKDGPTVEVTLPGSGKQRVTVPVLNHPMKPNEGVYEYRNSKLTFGYFRPDGSFDPQPGSIVRRMEHYQADQADTTRIYNLPYEPVVKP